MAAPCVFVGWSAVACSGAFALVDPDPASDCVALFWAGGLAGFGFGFGWGAGAGLLFTGAAPGGSALPPFCQENARKPPLGTLVPLTPDDEKCHSPFPLDQ